MDNRLDRSRRMFRIGLGVGPILAGLDKFFNLLTNWQMYLNPLAAKLFATSKFLWQPSPWPHCQSRAIVAGRVTLESNSRIAHRSAA